MKNRAPNILLRALLVGFTLLSFTPAYSQNLDQIGQGKPVTVNGGINASTVFYNATGMDGHRDNFNYFLSGNLSLSVYGWTVPLTFSYSNQQAAFQQPFNQYGMSPTYKWLTFHIGYRSMSFSNYTVNGHLFAGGGIEANPTEKFKISAFYGRLQKAVEEDTTEGNNIPAYKRMGGGVKVSLGSSKNSVDLIIFKAWDDSTSLVQVPSQTIVRPEENLVLGLNATITPLKQLVLKLEFASSALTQDIKSEEANASGIFEKLDFALTSRTSTAYYQAFKAEMQYAFKGLGIGTAYERIDPGYRTLGAYYFNNNIESYAVNASSAFLKNKIRLSSQLGIQRNNLDQDEINTTNRLSGSASVQVTPSKRINANLSFSNFQTVVNFRTPLEYINTPLPYQNLDTLNYKQVVQNSTAAINWVISETKERRQSIGTNISYQSTNDTQGQTSQTSGGKFMTINANYTLSKPERNLNISAAINTYYSQFVTGSNILYGPSLSVRRLLANKKLTTSGTVSFNRGGASRDQVLNARVGGNYTWKEKHGFELSITGIDRRSQTPEQMREIRELTIQFGYNYNFSTE